MKFRKCLLILSFLKILIVIFGAINFLNFKTTIAKSLEEISEAPLPIEFSARFVSDDKTVFSLDSKIDYDDYYYINIGDSWWGIDVWDIETENIIGKDYVLFLRELLSEIKSVPRSSLKSFIFPIEEDEFKGNLILEFNTKSFILPNEYSDISEYGKQKHE